MPGHAPERLEAIVVIADKTHVEGRATILDFPDRSARQVGELGPHLLR